MGCLVVWMSGCLDVWMSGCLDVWMSCCPGSRSTFPSERTPCVARQSTWHQKLCWALATAVESTTGESSDCIAVSRSSVRRITSPSSLLVLDCVSRAIGVLIYEMLFGVSPFAVDDSNQLTTFKNIIQVHATRHRLGLVFVLQMNLTFPEHLCLRLCRPLCRFRLLKRRSTSPQKT